VTREWWWFVVQRVVVLVHLAVGDEGSEVFFGGGC